MKTLDLYTEGNEYYIEGTVTEYVGSYNIDDSTYYSGRSKDDSSVVLVPIPQDVVKYKNSGGIDVPDQITIFVPTPSERDYKRGWFNRYFARQVNIETAQYLEIDKAQYDSLQGGGNPLYTTVQLRWKISGPKRDILNEVGDITEPGVIDTNNRSIKFVEPQHPRLGMRLQNLLEFWSGKSEAYFGPALKSEGPKLEVVDKRNVAQTY